MNLKKLGPKEELGLSAGVMLIALAGWYLMLYQPVTKKTAELQALVNSQEDSLEAANKYKMNAAALQIKIDELHQQVGAWDARFPARTEIVSLAKQILNFGALHKLDLIEMRPSLYELYALEKAGAHVSGRYAMQLPLTCQFRGRYLDLGLMLEEISSLPFNVTISDVSMLPAEGRYPLLDVRLRLLLYVHL